MKAVFFALALFLLTPVLALGQNSPDPSGDWRGELAAGAVKMRIALHLGEISTMDSPDQGAFGVPARLTRNGSKVTVAINGVGSFEGELSQDGKALSGVLVQGSARMPIQFDRGVYLAARRPQTPTKPYPYQEIEARYDNPARPSVRLAGTLTVPRGPGPFPAVLLITGSGGQDRDESIFEHKPFLVLADYLTRRGIAVLRVDDRGMGQSVGATRNDTSADYATDVEAGVAWLKSRPEIDARKIGLIGHSEGGMIAPMVASRDPSIAFLVLWAGPGVRGRDIVVEQIRALNTQAGQPPAAVARAVSLQERILDAMMAAPDEEAAVAAGTKVVVEAGVTRPPDGIRSMASSWYRYFLAHDPGPVLMSVKAPVLALLGEKDIQVQPAQNLEPLRAALAGNMHSEVKVLPSLNHLFQTAKTGAVDEYGAIEETMASSALTLIGDWVIAQSR